MTIGGWKRLVCCCCLMLCGPLCAVATTRILFLGDSITAGYGLTPAQAFPQRVIEALALRGHTDIEGINAGISGSTSASALSRLQWHIRVRPDILVLALGGNDGLRGLPVESLRNNLSATIEFALDQGLKVILAGMEMPPNYGAAYTDAFRRVYEELARTYRVTFMPFLLKDVGGRPTLNLPDGIHPTAAGHRIIADNMLPYLLEIL
jgi:acyl-CoA thioesterase I